jgi:hypothetical protein
VLESVCGVLIDARVGLVLVDELHNVSLTTRSGAEVADTLKYFSERIPATLVYAGINVEREGLGNGKIPSDRGDRTGSRQRASGHLKNGPAVGCSRVGVSWGGSEP